jgi:hypothetical protein
VSGGTVMLVPRRADGGQRDRLWSFCRARWADSLPEVPAFEGHHGADEGPFNRSAAVNRAAEAAGDWDVAVVMDADVLPDPHALRAAAATALGTGGPAIAFDRRKHLTARGTAKILDEGFRGSWLPFVKHDLTASVSGAYAVRRDLWDAVGGFDELFSGWGWEDVAFRIATETVAGKPPVRVAADLWHLWHPKSPENDHASPTFLANRARGDRYKAARWDRAAVGALLAEAAEARGAVPPPPPAARPGREGSIPRVLHRTVPERPSEAAEAYWAGAVRLHPGWEALDHRDPLDPAAWPETGDLWARCSSGAQKAGLIRLEALWARGGIYLDSDVELYRSLEPLTALEGFAGWEDRRCAPDAVLGFRPGHPAVAVMLERARAAVLRGAGAWESGPGVTTAVLPGRPDVLMLPPGSFYPYHYTTKERDRGRDHAAEQPWAFGAHHWAHSWKGR